VKRTELAAFAMVLGFAIGSVGHAQKDSAKPEAKTPRLTPMDVIEIRQLVARYAYAVDTGADNGNVYASLFAPDGVFLDRTGRPTSGKDALAALARRNTRGQQSAFHFIMNHVIEPTADGARGKEYLVQLRMGEGERPNDIFGGGHYEDVYVKTPDGWRFKQRQFIPSERPAPRSAPAR
jgi:actinorhodin biosynthesis protein ActVIA